MDSGHDLAVSDFEDSTGKTLREVVDKFILASSDAFTNLVVFKMTLDLAVQCVGHVHPLLEPLQRLKLVL